MGFADRKFEITTVALVAVMVGGIYSLFKAPQDPRKMDAEIVYEMPRPKHFSGSGFDLDGREIDRNYINPFNKKKADAKAQADAKAAQPAPAAAAAKKATAKKKTEDKKNGMEVNIVNNGPEGSTLSPDSGSSSGRTSAPVQQSGPVQTAKSNETTTDKQKTSAAEWKNLLESQPTSENLAKLIQAYMKGDVDQAAYSSIVVGLLNSDKADVQMLGLDAANYAFNVTVFSTVAKKYDSYTGEVKTQAHSYLLSYAAGTRLSILNAALKSSDSEVVLTAAEIVLAGYNQAKNGGTGGTRPGRGEGTSSLTYYAQFVPVFQTLSQSNDADVASAAQSALNQLQTVVASL